MRQDLNEAPTRLRLRSAGAYAPPPARFLSADATVCRDGAGSERLGCHCVAPAFGRAGAKPRLLREGDYAGAGRGMSTERSDLRSGCVSGASEPIGERGSEGFGSGKKLENYWMRGDLAK